MPHLHPEAAAIRRPSDPERPVNAVSRRFRLPRPGVSGRADWESHHRPNARSGRRRKRDQSAHSDAIVGVIAGLPWAPRSAKRAVGEILCGVSHLVRPAFEGGELLDTDKAEKLPGPLCHDSGKIKTSIS